MKCIMGKITVILPQASIHYYNQILEQNPHLTILKRNQPQTVVKCLLKVGSGRKWMENNGTKKTNSKIERPVLVGFLLQCTYICLEDGLSIFITWVAFHELIKHRNKTKGKNSIIAMRLLVPHKMMLDNKLLQHGVVGTWNWSFISIQEIGLCFSDRGHI